MRIACIGVNRPHSSSYLTTLDPRTCQGLSAPVQVRVIEYLIDPQVAQQLEQVTPSRMHNSSGSTNPPVRFKGSSV